MYTPPLLFLSVFVLPSGRWSREQTTSKISKKSSMRNLVQSQCFFCASLKPHHIFSHILSNVSIHKGPKWSSKPPPSFGESSIAVAPPLLFLFAFGRTDTKDGTEHPQSTLSMVKPKKFGLTLDGQLKSNQGQLKSKGIHKDP